MSRAERYFQLCDNIRQLDSEGHALNSAEMFEAYMRRNMFGFDPNRRLYRIVQTRLLEADIQSGVLTLPQVSAGFWSDPLENPLAHVVGRDDVTGGKIDYGAVVRSLHGQCWTQRSKATEGDWESFSHGNPATRITTTARRLFERIAVRNDLSYMHRTWLIEVEYIRESRIRAMQTPGGVVERLESTGAALALSSATVRSKFIDEDEVRLLYDTALRPLPTGVHVDTTSQLVRIPFDWDGVIEAREERPR